MRLSGLAVLASAMLILPALDMAVFDRMIVRAEEPAESISEQQDYETLKAMLEARNPDLANAIDQKLKEIDGGGGTPGDKRARKIKYLDKEYKKLQEAKEAGVAAAGTEKTLNLMLIMEHSFKLTRENWLAEIRFLGFKDEFNKTAGELEEKRKLAADEAAKEAQKTEVEKPKQAEKEPPAKETPKAEEKKQESAVIDTSAAPASGDYETLQAMLKERNPDLANKIDQKLKEIDAGGGSPAEKKAKKSKYIDKEYNKFKAAFHTANAAGVADAGTKEVLTLMFLLNNRLLPREDLMKEIAKRGLKDEFDKTAARLEDERKRAAEKAEKEQPAKPAQKAEEKPKRATEKQKPPKAAEKPKKGKAKRKEKEAGSAR